MTTHGSRGPRRVIAALLVLLVLVGCDPAIFRKPLEDFRNANQTLREAYFVQLGIARDAHVERFVAQRKLQLWQNPIVLSDPARVQQIVDTIAKREAQDDLDRDWVRLRVKAFEAIDTYAALLLALASNEDTEAIATELNGLVGDLSGLLDLVKKSERLAKLSFVGGTAEKAAGWIGGLSVAVSAFNEILRLVSNVVRSKAIVDTIVAADPAIIQLLNILGEEAAFAQNEAKTQYQGTITFLQATLKEKLVDQAAAREIVDKLAQLQTRRDRLQTVDELAGMFTLAKGAQAALVRKAAKPDQQDLIAHVRVFKERTTAIKQSLEAIRNDR